MKRLRKLQKQGWIFTIWLVANGSCIIQGKFGNGPDDFDFDVQANSFSLAARQAVWEVEMRERRRAISEGRKEKENERP